VISLSSAGESLNSSCLEWTTAASSSLPSWGRRLGELVGGCLRVACLDRLKNVTLHKN
jgi:hypothetical protein